MLVQAKVTLEESKLPSKVLHAIWNLSDVDKDSRKVAMKLFRVLWPSCVVEEAQG